MLHFGHYVISGAFGHNSSLVLHTSFHLPFSVTRMPQNADGSAQNNGAQQRPGQQEEASPLRQLINFAQVRITQTHRFACSNSVCLQRALLIWTITQLGTYETTHRSLSRLFLIHFLQSIQILLTKTPSHHSLTTGSSDSSIPAANNP